MTTIASILMISYHVEEIGREELITEYSNKHLWEKPQDEPLCEQLSVLIESQKQMDFSRFNVNMN